MSNSKLVMTYEGPPITDTELLAALPLELQELLRARNGYIAYGGGLHLRGACLEPVWHSLRQAMEGPLAFHTLYPQVQASDIPFAEDCLGDQYLLRGGQVHRLLGETGQCVTISPTLKAWLSAIDTDPVAVLSLEPLLHFLSEGGELQPGQLLSPFPPFCSKEAENGVDLQAMDHDVMIKVNAQIAAVVAKHPPGTKFQFTAD